MKTANYLGVVLVVLALCVCGCQLFPADHPMLHSQSPLKPAPASADSVAMEIVWARFPANDPVLDDAAWHNIDETQIDPTVRRELVNNGLRAGVISGALPPTIDKVLHQGASTDAPTEKANSKADTTKSQTARFAHRTDHPRSHASAAPQRALRNPSLRIVRLNAAAH